MLRVADADRSRRGDPRLARLRSSPRTPLALLVVVALLLLGSRSLFLGEPCQSPCTTANDHTLIFDEAYYVNAARVIAGIRPPAGAHYADAPLGVDPNAEHPQGAKLIMAAGIDIFGDGPLAWRLGSLIMGTLAVLGMYALVRSAGGGRWMALGAATLMSCDNLLLVMGRIGTLDIYCLAGMIWGVALYLWRKPVAAGVVLAIATAFKEVAPYVGLVLVLVELGRLIVAWRNADAPADWRPWPALKRLLGCGFVTAGVFLGLLAIMDAIAQPYADADHALITGGPWNEVLHIINYAKSLTSPNGPTGIASYPWAWLIDLKPIDYFSVRAPLPGHTANAIGPVSAFYGMISPPILLVGLLGLVFAAYRIFRRGRPGEAAAVWDRQVAVVGLAWFLGTWLPYALQTLIAQRTSYLYYMTIVTPGVYVAAIYLVSVGWRNGRRWLRGLELVWALAVLAAVIVMYPFVAVF